MRKKILFAVMALLVMATGKIWAAETGEGGTTTDGSIAYVVLCNDNSLHFLCSNETLAVDGTLSENGPIISEVWSGDKVLKTGDMPPGWQSNNSSVTSVVIDKSFENARPMSCFGWFWVLKQCRTIEGIEHLNTSEVTKMSYMFYGCSSLSSLDLSNFDTSKVEDMQGMFYGCSKLTSLNLSSFDTSNVTDTSLMFCDCSGLTTLDLSNFVTSIVANMQGMFYGCSGLTTLDLSNFVTSNVTDMFFMFGGCSGLTTLNLSNFNTSNVTNMQLMFDSCSKLSLLDLSKAKEGEKVKISDVIGTLPDNVYPVIYVLAGTTETGGRKNVINGDECESLLIDANNITTLSLPYSFTAKSVTFKRSFVAGKAHTICLPFELKTSATADYKLYEYDAYKDGKVKFKDAPSTTTPHKPYLLVPSKTLEEITVENATISATTSEAAAAEEEGFNGVYKKMVFTAEVLDGDYDYYGWTGNTDGKGEFRKAGEGAYVNACRAYIKLKNVSGNNAPARLSIELGDGTTGISSAKSDANGGTDADGGADAPVYNLQGQRVGSGYKGVVIKNGKKMIVK